MQVKSLKAKNFRNLSELYLEFGTGINILHGDNAQGKTNILEAVHLFSMGKSGRTPRDSELIKHDCDRAELTLEFSDKERTSTGEIKLFRSKKKLISVNEVPLKRNSELVGRFRVVYFGPEYLGLVKEGPKQRRKNTDILISQLRPKYFSAISDLKKIVESKNALLKMDKPNLTMLEIMNTKFAAISAEVIAYRSYYIKKIGEIAGKIQGEISGGKEELEVRYQSCIGDVSELSTEQIKEILEKKLSEASKREIDMHEALIGPHREDIGYFINGKDAKAYASQGQQKTIVLVQKLAEVQLIEEETGEPPVLLLDDIMSELDRKRQGFILNHIKNMQIIITCTDTEGFEIDDQAVLFKVEDARVTLDNA